MVEETVSFEPIGPELAAGDARPADATPLPLPLLALSLPLIAIGAVVFCCVLGAAAVAVLYLRLGLDGLEDFYQDLRFDYPLRTQIGAACVGALYVGVAGTTLGLAVLRGGRYWTALVGLTRVRGSRRTIVFLVLATLAYAVAATLTMTLMQGNRLAVSGPTDLALLGTFTANLVLFAPCAEEIVFRGWLYTGLRRRLPFWSSFLLTASLFAAIHWDVNHRRIFLVLPLALALGVLREVTGSIKPTIALHAAYNLIIVAITLIET